MDVEKVQSTLQRARNVLTLEAEGLIASAGLLGPQFIKAIEIIDNASGRIVTTGIGKSGIVARKIAATLNSTGTPSIYLSPVNALHGDIGVVQEGDVGLLFSKSGYSGELEEIQRAFARRSVPSILVTAAESTNLTNDAAVVIRIASAQEACPLELAPTTSTISMIGVGDALAILLMEERGFDVVDFARNHPSGSIGRRLTMRVEDLMVTGAEIPKVDEGAPLRDVVLEMTRKRLGATCVIREELLVGIITDGDLRRTFTEVDNIEEQTAVDMMSRNPMTIEPESAARHALEILEQTKRTHLPVVEAKHLIGFLHLHHLVEAGL